MIEEKTTILAGARVETLAGTSVTADGVAMRGSRIIGVGGVGPLREAHPEAGVVDLGGGLLLPAFGDGHVHPLMGGSYLLQCDLRPAGADASGYLEILAEYAQRQNRGEWVLGAGWVLPAFPGGVPHRDLLDRVIADRPVAVRGRDGHAMWLNTAALARAGITADTADPPGGRIERDEDGVPSGTLHEAAVALVEPLLPEPTPTQRLEAFRAAQEHLHSLGIVSVFDALATPEVHETYLAVSAAGDLTLSATLALDWDSERGLEQIADLETRRTDGAVPGVNPIGVKLFVDGVVGNGSAHLLAPYTSGAAKGRLGEALFTTVELGEIVTALESSGFRLHFHAMGDGAVRMAFDALGEYAPAPSAHSRPRHQVCHLQLVDQEELRRFHERGVVANFQPFWARRDEYVEDLHAPALGKERSARMFPIRSLEEHGARIAFGSDWPVSTASPLMGAEVAVTRCDPLNKHAEPLVAAEGITLRSALAAYTTGVAHATYREQETGTIEAGKLADLVLLDRDIFDHNTPISDARVLMTWAQGRVVHQASAGSPPHHPPEGDV